MKIFGPFWSKRLGRCLGIDHLGGAYCNYRCVYCPFEGVQQICGQKKFVSSAEPVTLVRQYLSQIGEEAGEIDFLVIAPRGEPTLDVQLGRWLKQFGEIGIPVAVCTNGGLLGSPAVRRNLAAADRVCIRLDTVDEPLWRWLNRPVENSDFEQIKRGMIQFSREYGGTLVCETRLVQGLNDRPLALQRTARFLSALEPAVAYLSAPLPERAKIWAGKPNAAGILRAYRVFAAHLPVVEILGNGKMPPRFGRLVPKFIQKRRYARENSKDIGAGRF